jgi:hypothetical protein
VLDSGKALNAQTIGDHLNISRSAVWAMRKRHPWLEAWVNDIVEKANANIVQLVIRKMGSVALKGSVDHATLFLKAQGKLQGDSDGRGTVNVGFNVQIDGIPQATTPAAWPGGVLEAPKV